MTAGDLDLSAFPELPERRAIALADKSAYDRALAASPSPASEMLFANAYLFRTAHETTIARSHGCLVTIEHGYAGELYAMPPVGPGDRRAAFEAAFDAMAAEGAEPLLACASESDLDALLPDRDRFDILEDRDNFDYVYERAALAALRGNRYHRQKNLINRFSRRHAWESVPFGEDYINGAVALADAWCSFRCAFDRPSTFGETEALMEGARRFREIGLSGRVVLVDGRVEAVALGEPGVAECLAVCHFEKANPEMTGLSQVVCREFAAHVFPGAERLNREQDLGDPGLRRAKGSYRPVDFVKKFRVRPR